MKHQLKKSLDKRNYQELRVIDICFDNNSLDKITPGLKMLYAYNDPPVFITVEHSKEQNLQYE